MSQPTTLPRQTRQLLVVTTPSWRSTTGTLQRYRRLNENWQPIGSRIPVSVGKSGLAWGRGLHRVPENAREKQEGDGCAPAGVFAIGPAFGYAAQAPAGCKLSYRPSSDRDYFIDDPTSADYNRWIMIPAEKPNAPKRFWKSCEKMRRADAFYEWGIVIQQNDHPVVRGKGSAIFLHVWKRPDVATVGCTAMAREDLLELLRWLDPKQRPLLVQAPTDEIKNLLAIELAQ
jgi:L,D-peptidoglycan transpeptidase YkuD (ErfK/YbiS/YcfS/YnhG family)